jgi:hypothetical protein
VAAGRGGAAVAGEVLTRRCPLGGDGARGFTRKALEKMFAQGLLRTPDSASVLRRAGDEIIRRRH